MAGRICTDTDSLFSVLFDTEHAPVPVARFSGLHDFVGRTD